MSHALKNLATIVRNHHTNWINHNGTIDDKDIFISKIINLSDYVERIAEKLAQNLKRPEEVSEMTQK